MDELFLFFGFLFMIFGDKPEIQHTGLVLALIGAFLWMVERSKK